MEKLKISCEIVTPLLMHGSDGKSAEIREQSIKGVMRYWWRAIHGNLKDLKEKEAEIFGNTNRKSSFRIKIKNKNVSDVTYFEYQKELQNKYGLKYLWYPIMMAKKNDTPWLIEKGNFEIEFYFKDEKSKNEIIHVLNYINYFGSFGARSRRGAGSIKFKSNNLIKYTGSNKGEFKKFIENNFEKKPKLEYPTFVKNIYIFTPHSSWINALDYIGEYYSHFRKNHKSEVYRTPAFGFPVIHRNGTFLGVKEKNKIICDFLERRASPVIFKIYKANDNTYFPLIIWMEGKILRDKYKIGKKERFCSKNHLKNINDEIIYEFFNSLPKEKYVKW